MTKPNTSRRDFMRQLAPLGLAVLAGGAAVSPVLRDRAVAAEKLTDEQICQRKFALAAKESLQNRPMAEVMVTVGRSFLATPYVANTLEALDDERVVVNLRGLDCVTFVENTLALSRCITMKEHTFEAFKAELKFIRYRGGVLNGYPSRLHYFSDWIDDNEKKNVVRNVSQEIGGVLHERHLTFMSTHPESYKQLSNTRYLQKIKEIESEIDRRQHYYIPKDRIKDVEEKIEPGDIIGITTSIEGLDIVHTGIALRANGLLKYLHAPLSSGKVQITERSLAAYVSLHKNQTGIMVARPMGPVS